MNRTTLLIVAACSRGPRTPDRTKDTKDTIAKTAEGGGRADATAMPPAADAARTKEVEEALQSLSSEHPQNVPPAAWWKAHAAEVRPELRSWLADGKDDGNNDLWAIQILGDLGEPADVELLEQVLNTWRTDTSRAKAGHALGVHPSPDAGAALISATSSSDVNTASYATSGLGERKGDTAARAQLEKLLDHTDSTIRFRAANALGELGAGRDALVRRKKVEKDAEVKGAIEKALGKQP